MLAGWDAKNLTNHSGKKRMIQKLNDQGVPPTHIMQISEHKNIQSLKNYSILCEHQQRNIFNIPSGYPEVPGPSGYHRRGSRINTDLSPKRAPKAQASRGSKNILSLEIFWILTPWSLVWGFWVIQTLYWPVLFSLDETLQICGLFHQGQFPCSSGNGTKRVLSICKF